MRIVELPESKKAIYIRENPKELPLNRWTDFQKYLIQVAGIGSDWSAVEAHFQNYFRLIGSGFHEDAAREAFNLYNNFHLMINKFDITSIAFGCLVDSIMHYEDPKRPETAVMEKIIDFSEEGLKALGDRLGSYGLTREMVGDIISNVKKKSILP